MKHRIDPVTKATRAVEDTTVGELLSALPTLATLRLNLLAVPLTQNPKKSHLPV
ncbi:MAG: hypothetical protein J0M26_06450 [Planctomycetes bacterium]|nr:hypothetical protein [Planctomycetota bacterium]